MQRRAATATNQNLQAVAGELTTSSSFFCAPVLELSTGATEIFSCDEHLLIVRRSLWKPQVLMAEASERVSWHEAMDSGAAPSDRQQVLDLSPVATVRRHAAAAGFCSALAQSAEGAQCPAPAYVQERRMVEYVSLGDYQSAVGFLLALPPDRSAPYYRDALCTLALAHAAAAVDSKQNAGNPAASESGTDTSARAVPETPSVAIPQPPPASSLLWQAAKVQQAAGGLLCNVNHACAAPRCLYLRPS
jgi:hypothetical protein